MTTSYHENVFSATTMSPALKPHLLFETSSSSLCCSFSAVSLCCLRSSEYQHPVMTSGTCCTRCTPQDVSRVYQNGADQTSNPTEEFFGLGKVLGWRFKICLIPGAGIWLGHVKLPRSSMQWKRAYWKLCFMTNASYFFMIPQHVKSICDSLFMTSQMREKKNYELSRCTVYAFNKEGSKWRDTFSINSISSFLYFMLLDMKRVGCNTWSEEVQQTTTQVSVSQLSFPFD